MTLDGTPGTVTVHRRGRTGLYADDHGVTVRNRASRTRQFAWAEISCFADGARYIEGSYDWVLHIVLRTGRKVTVTAMPPTPETLAAIRQVAARYGVPADLAGVVSRRAPLERRHVALGVRGRRAVRTRCAQCLEGPEVPPAAR